MRCFISINLPDALKMEIYDSMEPLRRSNADVRWVPAENLHITLKFLGQTDEEVVEDMKQKLTAVAGCHQSFSIGLHGTGLFPDKRRPRVIWIDIVDIGALKQLQEEVEKIAIMLGFEKENKTFSPHLTVGRVRSSSGIGHMLKRMEELNDRNFGNIQVNAVSLMKSDLKPSGSRYTTLADFNLRK